MATARTWTFKKQLDTQRGMSAQQWCWEARTADASHSQSENAFQSLEDCWRDALTNGFELPHADKPWEGFSIRVLDDGSLVYSPVTAPLSSRL